MKKKEGYDRVNIYIESDLYKLIKEFRHKHKHDSIAEAIRQILKDRLRQEGFYQD